MICWVASMVPHSCTCDIVRTRAHVHTHTHMYTCTYAHIYIHIHPRDRDPSSSVSPWLWSAHATVGTLLEKSIEQFFLSEIWKNAKRRSNSIIYAKRERAKYVRLQDNDNDKPNEMLKKKKKEYSRDPRLNVKKIKMLMCIVKKIKLSMFGGNKFSVDYFCFAHAKSFMFRLLCS